MIRRAHVSRKRERQQQAAASRGSLMGCFVPPLQPNPSVGGGGEAAHQCSRADSSRQEGVFFVFSDFTETGRAAHGEGMGTGATAAVSLSTVKRIGACLHATIILITCSWLVKAVPCEARVSHTMHTARELYVSVSILGRHHSRTGGMQCAWALPCSVVCALLPCCGCALCSNLHSLFNATSLSPACNPASSAALRV